MILTRDPKPNVFIIPPLEMILIAGSFNGFNNCVYSGQAGIRLSRKILAVMLESFETMNPQNNLYQGLMG